MLFLQTGTLLNHVDSGGILPAVCARWLAPLRGKYAPLIDLTFLGTATSTGVPVIGCDCDVCRSPDPRDQRLRSSALIRTAQRTILIDTSPDLRAQMLRDGGRHIDAVLYTHMHADHTAGIDELRLFNAMQQERIPTYANNDTADDLEGRFTYAFEETFPVFGLKPDLTMHRLTSNAPFRVGEVEVQPIPVMHGTLPIIGYRIGDIAYLTDVKTVPDDARPLLEDLDVLVTTALRIDGHPAHCSLSEALDLIAEIKPRRAYLSHIAHQLGRYADVAPTLPAHVTLAYDGLAVRSESPVVTTRPSP